MITFDSQFSILISQLILDRTIRFKDISLDEGGILILNLKTAAPAYHGGRIGAFHRERRTGTDRDVREPLASVKILK